MQELADDYQRALADISSLRAIYDTEIEGLTEELSQCKAAHGEERDLRDFSEQSGNGTLWVRAELASLQEQLQSAKAQQDAAKKSQSLQDVLSKRVVQLEAKLHQQDMERDAMKEETIQIWRDQELEKLRPMAAATAEVEQRATSAEERGPGFGDIAWWPKVATCFDSHPKFFPAMAWKLPYRLIFARCPLNVTMSFSGNPSGAHASFCTISLERWQRRSDRLESLLRRVKCPRVESFEANGRIYQLPMSVTMPKEQFSQEELEYLCGNFDGDGCVSIGKSSGQLSLSLSQAIERADILIRFRNAVGGGIYRHTDGTGFSSACLRWVASGPVAQQAARILSSFPSMKQAQLRIAAEAANGTLAGGSRVEAADKLTLWKAQTYKPLQDTLKCTWPYFAGFFDAEGCITVGAVQTSICLNVSQVNPFVLHALLYFLQREGFQRWSLHRNKNGSFSLTCFHFATAKSCLGRLLANGLTLKRAQAEAVIKLTGTNHSQVREFVSQSNGQQGFYRRLDEEGIEKARDVQSQRRRVRRLEEKSQAEDFNNRSLEAAKEMVRQLKQRCQSLEAQLSKRPEHSMSLRSDPALMSRGSKPMTRPDHPIKSTGNMLPSKVPVTRVEGPLVGFSSALSPTAPNTPLLETRKVGVAVERPPVIQQDVVTNEALTSTPRRRRLTSFPRAWSLPTKGKKVQRLAGRPWRRLLRIANSIVKKQRVS
eukprot:s384_g9.t1